LAEWWGGDTPGCFGFAAGFSAAAASNLVFGSNPPYQISDFFGFYPKFGTFLQGVQSVQPSAGPTGTGYLGDDVLAIVAPGASGATLKVLTVDLVGAPLSYEIVTPGTGYNIANGLAVTGGAGTGATVDVLALTPYTASQLPQSVIQVFINLASASLQQARWRDSWLFGMHLYIAHYVTLYLSSEGQPVSSAGRAAISGLGKGIAVSKAAGDVSVSYETQVDENFTSWNLTTYGQQLVTMAKIIGMGPMYVR
jgi:hypothetical protein